ncbi:MAG: hypothetical protein AAGE84_10575 [Cyanobacteria bacterium P01_G01_bin.39]
MHVFGNHVEQTDFDDLMCGEIYPASIIKRSNDHWCDYLTDVNHAWSCAPSYEKEYGTGFIKAQEIIKYNLKIESLIFKERSPVGGVK